MEDSSQPMGCPFDPDHAQSLPSFPGSLAAPEGFKEKEVAQVHEAVGQNSQSDEPGL